MKSKCRTCLVLVIAAMAASSVNAQQDSQFAPSDSYQSILTRAGYGMSAGQPSIFAPPEFEPHPQGAPAPPGALMPQPNFDSEVDSAAALDNDPNLLDCGVAISPASVRNANWVVNLFGVSYWRDYEDSLRLGWNGAGTDLYSQDVENGNMTGMGLSIARRNCAGAGIEAIFWGLDEEDSVELPGPTYTYLAGLGNIAHSPSGSSVADIFNAGDSARLIRDTDIFNYEFNFLKNLGQYSTRRVRCGNYELMAGFRLFNFDESLRYVSDSSTAGYPAVLDYGLSANNSLAGFQLGGRSETCLTDRWRFSYSGTAGVFNNFIETRQQITDETGNQAMEFSDTKNDAAFLGQMDLGLIYQIAPNARAQAGYRVLGASGVALAADQIPADYTDTQALSSANSNGSLLLHGFYYGGELSF